MECKPCIILITRLNQKHVLRLTRIYIIYIIISYRLPLLPKAIIYSISKILIKVFFYSFPLSFFSLNSFSSSPLCTFIYRLTLWIPNDTRPISEKKWTRRLPPLCFKSSAWRWMSGLVSMERGWAAVPPAVAAAPGGIPNPRSAAEADVGTGRPAPGPSPGRPGIPGCGPIAAPGGSCWACTCWRSLGRSGLCCCNGSGKFSTFITSKEHRFLSLLSDKNMTTTFLFLPFSLSLSSWNVFLCIYFEQLSKMIILLKL